MPLRIAEVADACGGRDYDVVRQVDEEAVLDDAGAGFDSVCEVGGVGDGSEVAIEDDIALVGLVGGVAVHAHGLALRRGTASKRIVNPSRRG